MNSENLEQCPPLAPLEFFSLEADLLYLKTAPFSKLLKSPYQLMNTADWLDEEHFADVYMAWNEEGIYIDVHVNKPFEESSYPRYSEGDCVELFFDTRDLKTAGFATRFCHQFVFLAQPVQGIQALETTHFRSEDSHPLCDSSELQVEAKMGKDDYQLLIFIPSSCLHAFDPSTFDRIGFTYRIHRFKGAPQHFALSSAHFSIEQHPRLWASFKFLKR